MHHAIRDINLKFHCTHEEEKDFISASSFFAFHPCFLLLYYYLLVILISVYPPQDPIQRSKTAPVVLDARATY